MAWALCVWNFEKKKKKKKQKKKKILGTDLVVQFGACRENRRASATVQRHELAWPMDCGDSAA